MITAGCIGGLGVSDGDNDSNTSEYTGGIDGVEERQTEGEFNVEERDGGNTTLVQRSYEGGIVNHLIQWNKSEVYTISEGRVRDTSRVPFEDTDFDETYSIYAPDWYNTSDE